MHTIAVNNALVERPELVATSRSGEAGDADIAQAIAALADSSVTGNGMSISDRYRGVLIDLASKRHSYEFLMDNQERGVAAVESKIASVTGVSLDEEAANMVRYQNTYSAAAKMISTVQSMFDSLISMI